MKVLSSVSIDGRNFAVELDESDLDQQVTGSAQKVHQALMVVADSLIVRHLLEAELISSEHATSRLAEINSRAQRVPVS